MNSHPLLRAIASLSAFLILILFCLAISGSGPVSATDLSYSPTIQNAQNGVIDGDPLAIALAYIEANRQSFNLSNSDLTGIIVTDQYTSQHNGVTHIYLRQSYDGIEVFGANLNINIGPNGDVLNVGNRFLPSLAKRVNTTEPSILPASAVVSAGHSLGLEKSRPHIVLDKSGGRSQSARLSGGGISRRPIPVKLVYQPLEDGSVHLAWDLEIYEMDGQDYWSMRVDAIEGNVLHQFNYVDHDNLNLVAGSPSNLAVGPVLARSPAFDVPQDTPAGDQYRVFALPAENPERGDHTLVLGPADSSSSPYGWHDTDGQPGAEEIITRGNNVYAHEGGNNNGFSPDGTAALSFDFPFSISSSPDDYEAAAITNLFYWNNIVHDVLYQYGFDELSGNFQENNYEKGGIGSDSVVAQGQDSDVPNNANFFTLPDGENPTLQIGLWSYTAPMRDASLDNGIIVHEYGHGVTRRLIGGPENVSCLSNLEQPGEGWSDWLSLVFTMQDDDAGSDLRGIGTYVLGQPVSGPGIRGVPYSTEMSVNDLTYGDVPDLNIPHGVGSIWAAMLWEMTWALIDDYGFSDDFYHGNGGNNLALQLVIDSLKLQPCNPGFIDARDAILLADQLNNGGDNQCTIWTAFAKRGLGASAQQNSINNTRDGVEAFDLPDQCVPTLKIRSSANPSPVYSGDPLTYSLLVRNDSASTYTAVTITDTIPADVTYVDGSASASCSGTKSGSEVAFTLGSIAPDQQQTCSFDVAVNSDIGSVELFSDDMEDGGGQWTTSISAGPISWVLDGDDPHSSNTSWYAENGDAMSDLALTTSAPVLVSENTMLRFWHQFSTEPYFDGGVVEIEVDGAPWQDLGPAIVRGDYNIVMATAGLNPLAGRSAYSGYSNSYMETVADLGQYYAGSNVRLRFRFGTDSSSIGGEGWRIDDVQIINDYFISNTSCLDTAELYTYCDTIETPVLLRTGQPTTTDYPAESETSVSGSFTGSFVDTQADDDQIEELSEEQSGGKPSKRKSLLEHLWTFDVSVSNQATFRARAWAPTSLDGDTFQFAYSTNGSDWTYLADITASSSNATILSAQMAGVAGPVTIRLMDTNRQPGNTAVDTVFVDYLAIRTENYTAGPTPDAPTGLTATAINDNRIDLAWEDKASDEFGYQIERSLDQASWGLIATISANSTTYSDTDLQSGTAYYYRVRAYNNSGNSGYSNIAFDSTPGSSSSIHIGDLDGYTRYENKRRWLVEVTITVHDDQDLPVSGVTVSGHWLGDVGDPDSCVTGADGHCMIPLRRIPLSIPSVTFVVDDLVNQGVAYEPARNHDPDPDSDGTSITVEALN